MPPVIGSDVRPLDPAELGRLLRAADPAALLVPPRLLSRVIKHDRNLTGLGLQVPHRKSYVIGREALLALATRAELGLGPDRELPPTVVLIARPEPEQLAAMPRGPDLVKYWRLLFHARVHVAVAERRFSDAAVRERIHGLGWTEFDEIRTVLRQEKYLLPPRDDRTAYEEFAAVYLELRFFDAALLPLYFPTIEDFDHVDRMVAGDVDAVALFAATRPAGAPDPVCQVDSPDRAEEPWLEPTGVTTVPRAVSDEWYRALMARADRVAVAGNTVRAAIRRSQAALTAPPALAGTVQARAADELHNLVGRLQQALELNDPEAAAWRRALPALLPRAARGVWPAEARLLYDLQKACVDHERPAFAPDLVEWAYSHFRRPFVRPLPDQPLVLAVKHLRGAASRLVSVRVAESERHALSTLLRSALHHAEGRLRDRFRALLGDALGDVGLRPQNFPERVARDKLLEELLDRITERGFLTMGDLRDALSRNQLKLPDLSGPAEFVTGDPLIRANRALADRATGVYRRGEVYLRWLQRLTALAFGMRPGRWLTRFVALPFGGAYATVVFALEILHLVRLPHHLHPTELGATVGLLGIFYLLLLHLPTFRRLMAGGLRAGWIAVRTLVFDLPAAALRLPPLRRLLESRPFLFFARAVLKPLPAAALVWLALHAAGVGAGGAAAGAIAALVAASLLLNSGLGRDLEETVTDWAVRRWRFYRDLLPGLVRLVMDFFKGILDAIEKALYTVDEWLRFRGGEGRLTLIAKVVLGLVWSLVAYVVRLYLNVLVEPTVNPVKHFPAVTVAAKLLVPFWIPLTEFLAIPLMILGRPLAYTVAFLSLHALPGAAGFLVWELKANWRLYRANRPRALYPVAIGHHGETMPRLMRPGFHSGTLPKLYAKLRRAERKARRSGEWRAPRRLRESLHHIEEAVRHFVERELLAYLNGGHGWTAGPVSLATVEAGSNRIRVALACPVLGADRLELRFEEQSGWLLADVARTGWLSYVSAEQAAVLALALTSYYKESGVELIHEQIDASFAPPRPPYDIDDRGLILWPESEYESEVVYDLREGPVLHPRSVAGQPTAALPVLGANQILFRDRVVSWQDWVEAWERDQAGEGPPKPLVPGVRVLPPLPKPA
jgi:hypothetical protein